jgi:hypothetical protein
MFLDWGEIALCDQGSRCDGHQEVPSGAVNERTKFRSPRLKNRA